MILYFAHSLLPIFLSFFLLCSEVAYVSSVSLGPIDAIRISASHALGTSECNLGWRLSFLHSAAEVSGLSARRCYRSGIVDCVILAVVESDIWDVAIESKWEGSDLNTHGLKFSENNERNSCSASKCVKKLTDLISLPSRERHD
jgi:hypothetical protein